MDRFTEHVGCVGWLMLTVFIFILHIVKRIRMFWVKPEKRYYRILVISLCLEISLWIINASNNQISKNFFFVVGMIIFENDFKISLTIFFDVPISMRGWILRIETG